MSATVRTIAKKDYRKNIMEYPADAAINPGELVKLNSDGEVEVVSNKTEVGSSVGVMVALDQEQLGKGATEAYAAGDPVRVWFPLPGDEANLRVADSAAQPFVPGAPVYTGADGTVKQVSNSGTVVGTAVETFDPGAGNTGYIHVRFI